MHLWNRPHSFALVLLDGRDCTRGTEGRETGAGQIGPVAQSPSWLSVLAEQFVICWYLQQHKRLLNLVR